MFLEKYSFSYFVDSDEEYYDEKCIDLYLESINVFKKKIRKNKKETFLSSGL